MEPWLSALGSVGFPIVISFYLLTRLEPSIRSLEKTVTVLTVVVAKQNNIDYDKACELAGKEGSK